jgi:hypothetical protein
MMQTRRSPTLAAVAAPRILDLVLRGDADPVGVYMLVYQ